MQAVQKLLPQLLGFTNQVVQVQKTNQNPEKTELQKQQTHQKAYNALIRGVMTYK